MSVCINKPMAYLTTAAPVGKTNTMCLYVQIDEGMNFQDFSDLGVTDGVRRLEVKLKSGGPSSFEDYRKTHEFNQAVGETKVEVTVLDDATPPQEKGKTVIHHADADDK